MDLGESVERVDMRRSQPRELVADGDTLEIFRDSGVASRIVAGGELRQLGCSPVAGKGERDGSEIEQAVIGMTVEGNGKTDTDGVIEEIDSARLPMTHSARLERRAFKGIDDGDFGAGLDSMIDMKQIGKDNSDVNAEKSANFLGGSELNDQQSTRNGAQLDIARGSKNDVCDRARLSVHDLVAKGRAPVKSEFLKRAVVRVPVPNGTITGTTSCEDKTDPRIRPNTKSKRQLKRERLTAKKSIENICSFVARTGDEKKCPHGPECRFNHDLQGYIAQKPPDIPGECPSLYLGRPCFYGITCRFAGTHKEYDTLEHQEMRPMATPNEQNTLSKELQKLLWKKMWPCPKADAQLRSMELMGKAFKMRKVEGNESIEQGPGKVVTEELGIHCSGIENEVDGSVSRSSIDTMSTDVEHKCLMGEGHDTNTCGLVKPQSCAAEKGVLGGLVSLNVEVSGSTPQKRLRTELYSIFGNALDGHSRDKHGTDCEVETSFQAFSTNEVEVQCPVVDIDSSKILAKPEEVNSLLREEGWRFLHEESKLNAREKKIIDFREKLYLAPLTTVGNLPFRRVCKSFGADITCGEMAMCTNVLQGHASEWALLRRHVSEDLFGVQICGSFPDHVARTAELIERECSVDFIDINMGCPIDLVVNKGSGSCLLTKPRRLEQIVRVTAAVMEKPLTLKVRMGYYEGRNCAHLFMPNLNSWGVNAVTIHGRTRQQHYSKVADWEYVQQCAAAAQGDLQVIGNGDIFSYTDWTEHLKTSGAKLSTTMIARGALIKPWIFCEIKEARHWDISSGERLDILKQYVQCGLAHWGSDNKGVETTRHFLLEWLSYMHRYIPVGLLEVVPQRLNWRPPSYFGRNDLETLMASECATDWVKITELLLGPTPANFVFNPKHKSNAYDKAENG